MDNKELYNMVKEHLMGIEKNTGKIAKILDMAKDVISYVAAVCFIVVIIHVFFK